MGFGNTPSPPLPFLGNSCGKGKKRKRKKSPTTKGDNRITGTAANTLCLRHSMQDAYSNRNFFFFVQRESEMQKFEMYSFAHPEH